MTSNSVTSNSHPRPFLFLSARPELEAVEAEYLSMLRAAQLTADELVHLKLDQEPWDCDRHNLDKFAGVIVGGSPFNVTAQSKSATQLRVEADLAQLAEDALSNNRFMLFTCYGIGILTQVLGGTVDLEHGEDTAAVTVTLNDAGRADRLTGVLPQQFEALVGHKEATGVLPTSCTLLGSTPGCPVQIYRATPTVYATQFHPDVNAREFIARAHVYRDHGYFPAEQLAAVTDRLGAASIIEPQRLVQRFVELASGL